jgi:hypothetical protein
VNTSGVDFIGLNPISLLIFLLLPFEKQKGGNLPPIRSYRKSCLISIANIMAKIADICNELQNTSFFFVFFCLSNDYSKSLPSM